MRTSIERNWYLENVEFIQLPRAICYQSNAKFTLQNMRLRSVSLCRINYLYVSFTFYCSISGYAIYTYRMFVLSQRVMNASVLATKMFQAISDGDVDALKEILTEQSPQLNEIRTVSRNLFLSFILFHLVASYVG